MKEIYDENYFERGLQLGISGYTSYSWMPELTLKMAEFLINELELKNKKVLDFGCAKGYLVKALRIYGIEAYGYDASEYATTHVPLEIRKYCYWSGNNPIKSILSNNNIDIIISKDVFEHLSEHELIDLLKGIKDSSVKEIYVVVPTSIKNEGNYIIEAYENDKTHILRKTIGWWENTLKDNLNFEIVMSAKAWSNKRKLDKDA